MVAVIVCGVVVAAMFPAMLCCFSISEWHSNESDYWNHVALLVRLSPALDEKYRPVLDWAKANRPSIWRRMGQWHSPEDRMRAAS